MAHPSKFVSVNLNKYYGKPSSPSPANARTRGGSHPTAGGGGGGMVVLSRPRSSSSSTSSLQKMGPPKLSVPPPLNLPSLRKENEKCDHQSFLGSSTRPGSSGSGSSTTGWTKPAALLPEKESAPPPSGKQVGTAYMPPVARGLPGPSSTAPTIEKAVFLRGEDFPSLKATFTLPSKEREVSNQKARERPEFRSPIHMRPQTRSSMLVSNNAGDIDDRNLVEQSRKQSETQEKYFPGPLPLVKLAHTSDWADDERDTGLRLPERDRDHGFSRMDFVEVRGPSSKDFYKGSSFGMNKDSWKGPSPSPLQLGFDRDNFRPKPIGASRETNAHLPYGESNGAQDSRYPKRDLGFATSFQNGMNASTEGFVGRGNENVRSGQYGDPSNNRNRGNSFQSTAAQKLPFSAGSKGLSVNDPILNFGRDKRLGASGGKSYLGDADFNGTDHLSDDQIGIGEVNVKMLKRKKEILKQTEFHDPVRASFEAELERVQRIQEQERQRAMEEQARAMDIARMEQEERERLGREEEERRRRMEEEAREAAWRAEQDRMEAVRRAEEQKIAREGEKRRLFMEEERRKEAARKKLLELEAKIARRQTETQYKDENVTGDEEPTGLVKENEVPKVASDVGDWEDGERMVEHITNTASSESSSTNRYFDTGLSRMQSSRDVNTSFMERGKHGNYGKRDTYDNGSSSLFHLQDQESDFHGSRRDTFSSGRAISRKDNFGGFVPSSIRPSPKGGTAERSSMPDGFRCSRGNRWNVGGDGNHFNVNLDVDGTEFIDNDKFGDGGWGSGRTHGNSNATYTERSFQNEVDGGFSSFGRSRHAFRQPHVLPPPSISSMRHTSFRNETNSSSTSFPDDQSRYHNAGRSLGEIMQSGYDGVYHQRDETPRPHEILGSDVISSEQKEEKDSPRCDSQSSLSVSNPPSSPTHLSHNDFDEADDSPSVQTAVVEDNAFLSENEHVASEIEVGNTNMMATSSSVSQGDDEWAIENNEELHEQDYDEEEDDYQEEEATHGGETPKFDHEFDDPPSDLPNKTNKIDQMVLSFNEGVEVSISTDNDLEKTLRNDEKRSGIQEALVGDHSLQVDNASIEGSVSEAAEILKETEKALEEPILDPLPISASNPPDSAEASSVQSMPIQKPVTSGLSSPVPYISTIQPVTSTFDSRVESPIRLQFGLFSGPSLIPSPVPAIQIGSIQMPLHLHPQVGSSITQLHPPEPPFFQFGQLRYPSPLSQGIFPLAPQTVSFVHSPTSAPYSLSQNLGGSLHSQASHVSSSQNSLPDKVPSGPLDKQPALLTKPIDLPQGNINYSQRDELSNSLKCEVASRSQTIIPSLDGEKTQHVSGYQNERHVAHDVSVRRNYRSVSNGRELHVYPGHLPSAGEKNQIGSRAPGIISSSKGNRFAYSARNAGTRSLFPAPETSRTDSSGFQRRPRRNVRRTEFRIRENVDKRDREALESYNNVSQDGRTNLNAKVSANSARYGVRKDDISNKFIKTRVESEDIDSGVSSMKLVGSAGKMDKLLGKEALSKKRVSSLENYQLGEVSRKVSIGSEEDVGAPLQSGVVCVFKQPGIEAPSDEDDFIEVRSKRQIVNARREQREKEIKAMSKVTKPPRKHHAVPQSNVVGFSYRKTVTSFVGDMTNTVHSDSVITDGRGFANVEPAPVFTSNISSQTLPLIGTPSARVETDARSKNLKSSQTSCAPVTSSGITKFVSGLSFENESTILVNASQPSSSWSNSDVNQQVMALTQSQLDDAMKPVRFDSQVASSISLEPTKPSTSVMPQEKPFPSSGSPLNSLLAGERIQFGAVTSPTILPPVSRAVSNGISPPRSSRLDVSKDHRLAATSNECTMFFDKKKHNDESCTHLEDPEAETAASAVAAISNNDEVVANRSGACSVSVSKSFSGADGTKLNSSGGVAVSKGATSQSVAEESLTVALPADLSVDTPLQLWHPLPSQQSTSGPMLFPQPSHFPIVDVNPIFGRPFIAIGPHDESGGTQEQPPRTTTLGSGPIGPWTQCHSGVDSFYGPPTGFAGPYISPPGGIPGVQAPSHMVFYNHFAPVGHLSFMGTAYIPTGKQPDWKHNPVSPATLGVSEGEITNMNVASGQRNPPNMPSTIQHLAPGSPLMPMASPLAMFDMSPFQSSADIPFQARWSHVPPPMHSVRSTMPLQQQQQVEGGMPSQFARSVPVDTSTAISRFNNPSTATDGIRGFSIPSDGATWFPNDLNLVEPPTISTSGVQTTRSTYNHSSANNSKGSNSSKSSSRSAGGSAGESGLSSNSGKIVGSSFKPQASQQHPIHPTGYGDPRGGSSQKMGSGGEWHRRVAYQGRGRGSSSDKSFAPSKMKQIYVAKPPATGTE